MLTHRRLLLVMTLLLLGCLQSITHAQRTRPAPQPRRAPRTRPAPAPAQDISGLWVGRMRMIGYWRVLDVALVQNGDRVVGEWRKEDVTLNPGKYAVVELGGVITRNRYVIREAGVIEDRMARSRPCGDGQLTLTLAADGTLNGRWRCGPEDDQVVLRRVGDGQTSAAARDVRLKWANTCSREPVIGAMPRLSRAYWNDPMVGLGSAFLGGSPDEVPLEPGEKILDDTLAFRSLDGLLPGLEPGSFACNVYLVRTVTIVQSKTGRSRPLQSFPEMTFLVSETAEGYRVRVNERASRVYEMAVPAR